MRSILLYAAILSRIHALEVSNGSTCVDSCNGPSLTFASDLVCRDIDYVGTTRGRLMKECIECESQSSHVDSEASPPQDNDQYWMLFNAKYTLQYCLTQSEAENTPNYQLCYEKCANIFPILTPSWFSDPSPAQYEYCSIADNALQDFANECTACLQSSEGSVILGNLLDLMKSGCDSRAAAQEGNLIPIQRELFNSETISSATSTSVSSSSSPSSRTSESPSATTTGDSVTDAPTTDSSSSDQTPSSSSSSTLSPGTAADIAIAVVLGVLGLALLIFYYIRRRRNTVHVPKSVLETSTTGQLPNYTDSKYGYAYGDMASQGQGHRQGHGQERSGLSTPLASGPVEVAGYQRYEMDSKGDAGVVVGELDGRAVKR